MADDSTALVIVQRISLYQSQEDINFVLPLFLFLFIKHNDHRFDTFMVVVDN